MPVLQVKDLDEGVLRTLKARAANEGKSLQAYMHALLTQLADRPTKQEWMERIERRAAQSPDEGITRELVVATIREDRDSR